MPPCCAAARPCSCWVEVFYSFAGIPWSVCDSHHAIAGLVVLLGFTIGLWVVWKDRED